MSLFGPPDVERLKEKKRLQGLQRALAYKHDADIRQQAARALAEIGDPRAVEPLVATLQDSSPEVREATTRALGQLGDARAVKPLINQLRDWRSDRLCNAARDALVQIGNPAVDALISVLGENIGSHAARALGQIGDDRAIDPLIAFLENPSDYRCDAAREALVAIGTPAVGPLCSVLRNGGHYARQQAVEALGQIGDPKAIPALLRPMGESADMNRRVSQALDQIGWAPDRSAAAAHYWITKGRWDKCAQIGKQAVPALIALLKASKIEQRRGAAQALVTIYRSGELDAADKNVIVARRGSITGEHSDRMVHDDGRSHDDVGCSSMSEMRHRDREEHHDKGIGVDFPL